MPTLSEMLRRGDKKNARNFVVFDLEKMTILERNAKEINDKPVKGMFP